MTGTVHEELPLMAHGIRVLGVARQHAEVDESGGDHPAGGGVLGGERASRPAFGQRRLLGGEHEVVDGPLRSA